MSNITNVDLAYFVIKMMKLYEEDMHSNSSIKYEKTKEKMYNLCEELYEKAHKGDK